MPEKVNVHDFPDKELGKAIPYGIYDLIKNEGWVNVGIDHDTAAFAVCKHSGMVGDHGALPVSGSQRPDGLPRCRRIAEKQRFIAGVYGKWSSAICQFFRACCPCCPSPSGNQANGIKLNIDSFHLSARTGVAGLLSVMR